MSAQTNKLFEQKSAADHARPAPADALVAKRHPLVLVLENIRSGNNVGSILRTADAFALEQVAMCGYTPTPPHREILKTSLGAEESVPWQQVPDLATYIAGYRAKGYRITALEQTSNSTALQAFDPSAYPGTLVILGNEVRGVSPEALALVDEVLEVPQFGAKQSLNVSVAAGVVVFALVG